MLKTAFKRRRKWLWRFILCMLLCVSVLVFLQVRIRPIIELVAAQRVHMEAIAIINDTVYDHLGAGLAYDQLIEVRTDANGNITMLQPDTVQISRLTTAIAQELEARLDEMSASGLNIPLGLLTGHALLATLGPNLHVEILPEGSVSTDIIDEFDAAGINQTRHRVVLDVKVSVGLLMPFSSTLVEINNALPLVESVIVGPVPDTYLHFDGQNGSLGEFSRLIAPQTSE